ncbi:UNVERIFIED_CONTAM: hypothetical protein GTU68_056515 [Idotea baltica]|nr:hypothetical protein [Idotea baltica]
MYMYVDSDRL